MTSSADPVQQMKDFLELQAEEVRNHVSIVTPEILEQPFLLRVDKVVPEKFIPNLPRSAMKRENNTVPRITTAPTLLGCFIGYFRAEYDIVFSGTTSKEEFRGGYEITQFPFDVALRPDNTLIPGEVDRTNEHWLVPHNPETVEMTPKSAGKCFISEVTYLNRGGKERAEIKVTLFLKNDIDGLCLLPKEPLKAGYYRVAIFWKNLLTRSIEDTSCVQHCAEITRDEFENQKSYSAALLSFTETGQAPFMGW